MLQFEGQGRQRERDGGALARAAAMALKLGRSRAPKAPTDRVTTGTTVNANAGPSAAASAPPRRFGFRSQKAVEPSDAPGRRTGGLRRGRGATQDAMSGALEGWGAPRPEQFPDAWDVVWEELPPPPVVKWVTKRHTYGCCPVRTGRKFRCCSVYCGCSVWCFVVLSFLGMAATPISFFPSSAAYETIWDAVVADPPAPDLTSTGMQSGAMCGFIALIVLINWSRMVCAQMRRARVTEEEESLADEEARARGEEVPPRPASTACGIERGCCAVQIAPNELDDERARQRKRAPKVFCCTGCVSLQHESNTRRKSRWHALCRSATWLLGWTLARAGSRRPTRPMRFSPRAARALARPIRPSIPSVHPAGRQGLASLSIVLAVNCISAASAIDSAHREVDLAVAQALQRATWLTRAGETLRVASELGESNQRLLQFDWPT